MPEIKAIIFDFGNVIATFDNNVFIQRISEYTEKSAEELTRLIYRESDLPRRFECGLMTDAEFYYAIRFLCLLDIPMDDFIRAYTEIFTPIEATNDLIAALKKKGYKLGLLSNTSHMDFTFGIKRIPAFNYFCAVTTSFEVGAMKPSGRIYSDALRKIGEPAEACVYIDDIEEYVAAAEKLGLRGIHYIGHDNLMEDLKKIGVEI